MTGNPKTSPWYTTPNSRRKRKQIILTLGPDALARLEWLAETRGESKSQIVEDLLLGGDER